MPKKKSKLEEVIKDTFELDEDREVKFKDKFDSFSIMIDSSGTKIERTRTKKEDKNG